MILVTGATGHLGGHVVRHLVEQGARDRVAVLARSEEKGELLKPLGVEVRIGDFDRLDSLAAAFDGVEQMLLVSTQSMDRAAQQAAVIDAAAAAGVRHIVYTGVALKHIETSAVRDVMGSHFETEAHLRASGIDFTFLRNTMYAEALTQIAGASAVSEGIALPGGRGRVPYASRAELGEAAANVLLHSGHAGKTYELVGARAHDYADVVQEISRRVGKPLAYQDIAEAVLKERLIASGMPAFFVQFTLGTLSDIKSGQYEVESTDLERLLGRKPKGLQELVGDVFFGGWLV